MRPSYALKHNPQHIIRKKDRYNQIGVCISCTVAIVQSLQCLHVKYPDGYRKLFQVEIASLQEEPAHTCYLDVEKVIFRHGCREIINDNLYIVLQYSTSC